MFNLFKKQNKPLSEYPQDQWSVLEQKDVGLVVRINDGLKDAVGHPDYSVKMGVAVPIQDESNDQLLQQKDKVEEKVNELLGSNGLVVCAITGVRDPKFFEFVAYTKNGLNFDAIGKELTATFPIFEIQMYAELDPKWETYQSFSKRV